MPFEDVLFGAAWMLPVMLLAIPFQFMYDTGLVTLRSLFLNRAFAVVSIVSVMLIWVSRSIVVSAYGLEGVVVSWSVVYAVIAVLLLAGLVCGIFRGVKALAVTASDRKEMIAYSLQYMITNGLWALFLQNDLLMINLITQSAESVADYKVASVFPALLALFSGAIGTFIAPHFIKNENNQFWVWRNYKRTLFANAGLVGLCSILIAVLAYPLVDFVYGDQYSNTVPLLYVLLIGSFFNNGVRYASANLFAAMGRIRVNLVIAACGIVLQIFLNLLLIPFYGVYGPAVTGVIVYCLMAIVVTAWFVREYRPSSNNQF